MILSDADEGLFRYEKEPPSNNAVVSSANGNDLCRERDYSRKMRKNKRPQHEYERCMWARHSMPAEHPNKKKDCFPPWEPTGDAMYYWHALYKRLEPCWEAYHNETLNGTKEFLIPKKEPGRAEVLAHELGMNITLDEAKFAYVLLVSRDFSGYQNVPILDIANTGKHPNALSRPVNTKSPDDDEETGQAFCLMATSDIKKGEEILDDYEQKQKVSDTWYPPSS